MDAAGRAIARFRQTVVMRMIATGHRARWHRDVHGTCQAIVIAPIRRATTLSHRQTVLLSMELMAIHACGGLGVGRTTAAAAARMWCRSIAIVHVLQALEHARTIRNVTTQHKYCR